MDMQPQEFIAGIPVHPAASIFPLLEGEEYEALVESIRMNGLQVPIVKHEGVLVDGRNRLRAIEELRAAGVTVSVRFSEWVPQRTETVARFIYDTNRYRRHLTDDGIAMVSSAIMPILKAEQDAARKATQFQKGTSGNPTGNKQVRTIPSEPARDHKAEDARSTVGKIAKQAGVSMHKARQAVAVQKAVESGEVSQEAVKEVIAGKKKLRDIAPKKPKPEQPIELPFAVAVSKAWVRLKADFTKEELPRVRRLIAAFISEAS